MGRRHTFVYDFLSLCSLMVFGRLTLSIHAIKTTDTRTHIYTHFLVHHEGRWQQLPFIEGCSSNSFASLWQGCSSFHGRPRRRLRLRSSCYEQMPRWTGNSKPEQEPIPPLCSLLSGAPDLPCCLPAATAPAPSLWHVWSAAHKHEEFSIHAQ